MGHSASHCNTDQMDDRSSDDLLCNDSFVETDISKVLTLIGICGNVNDIVQAKYQLGISQRGSDTSLRQSTWVCTKVGSVYLP